MVLESFLQAQKVSVRRSLQRSFRKYITYGEESNQLLMHQLQGLLVDAEKYKAVSLLSAFPCRAALIGAMSQLMKSTRGSTEVYINDLENRAKELSIFDLRPFYQSQVFKSHGMVVDLAHGVIVKQYA